MFYTGIGSRNTPQHVLYRMESIGKLYAEMGFILRSGGADAAFEKGCDSIGGQKEIYIPWNGFNNLYINNGYIVGNNIDAETIAGEAHPAWNRCSQGAKKLHTRNVYQVLGLELNSPSLLIICWTSDGLATGGTGQAIRIAESRKIKTLNLFNM